jgi:hypothetical protein
MAFGAGTKLVFEVTLGKLAAGVIALGGPALGAFLWVNSSLSALDKNVAVMSTDSTNVKENLGELKGSVKNPRR